MKKSKRKISEYIIKHIEKNLNDYIILIGIFIIGSIIGVVLINNMNNSQKEEIAQYITQYTDRIGSTDKVDYFQILKEDCRDNFIMCLFMWISSTVIIGLPIIYCIILFRGVCIGYTMAATIATLGLVRGTVFSICAMLLQNIIFIPAILVLGINSIKLYRKAIKERQRENIKREIYKYTIITLIIFVILTIGTLIKTFISYNLLIGYTAI